MTRAEVTEIFAVLMMAYPNAEMFKAPDKDSLKAKLAPTITLWTTCLRDIDFWAAQQAVIRVCQTCKFPPTIAEMREAAETVLHEVKSEINNAYLMARSELQLARLAGRTKEQALEGMPTRTQKVIEAMGGIDAFMSAKDDGLLEPVTFDAAAELGDEYKDTEGYWYSKGITIVGFLLNNSLMEELGLTAPESWDDLTDSQYEGEIVMSNPAVSGTNYAVVNALLQAKGDQGWDYFDALNNNIAYYGKRGSDPKNKVSSGEFAVGISYIDASIEQAAEENDLTIVYPSDGMPWVPEGVAVFKNAENVDAAKYFVEWLFSSDDHLRQLAEIEQKNGIKVIKPSIEGIELSYDPTLLMTEDLSLFGSQRTEILERFEPLMGDKAATE